MKRILTILVCALLLSASGASAHKHLVIVHVNDTHSHLDPERSGSRAGKGGIIERAAYLDSLRKAVGRRNVLLLHGGDWDQGSPYFTIFGGNLEVNLINSLKYDCLTLGNHEFDNGLEDLAARVAKIHPPVVCATYDFDSFDSNFGVRPYAVVRKAGMKIGIIGAICNISTNVAASTASRIKPLGDNVDIINRWAEHLRNEEKCDMVIVLSHMGYEADMDAASGLHGVDIIIGGHSHTIMKDLRYVDDADSKALPVIQDGYWGLTIGRLDVD